MKVTGSEFQVFANSLTSGHLKLWKANSIISTLVQMPSIIADDDRLIKYVNNCLEMEGFRTGDCKKVAEYIKENR